MDYLEIAKNTILTNDNIKRFDTLLHNSSPTKEERSSTFMRGVFFASRLPIPTNESQKLPISSIINYINSSINNTDNSILLFQHLVGLQIVTIDDQRIDSGNCYISEQFGKTVLALKDQLKLLDQKYKIGQEPADD